MAEAKQYSKMEKVVIQFSISNEQAFSYRWADAHTDPSQPYTMEFYLPQSIHTPHEWENLQKKLLESVEELLGAGFSGVHFQGAFQYEEKKVQGVFQELVKNYEQRHKESNIRLVLFPHTAELLIQDEDSAPRKNLNSFFQGKAEKSGSSKEALGWTPAAHEPPIPQIPMTSPCMVPQTKLAPMPDESAALAAEEAAPQEASGTEEAALETVPETDEAAPKTVPAAEDMPPKAGVSISAPSPGEGWTRIDGRYVLGKPSGSFYQTPFPAKQSGKSQHREDLSADIAQVGDLLVFGASMRGAMHYSSSTVRQDSFAIGAQESADGRQWVIAAVADGVSEAIRSHLLADYMVRQAVLQVSEELGRTEGGQLSSLDWNRIAQRLVAASQECCNRLAQGKVNPKHYLSKWASTLEFLVIQADSLCQRPFVCVTVAGDGAAYLLDKTEGWKVVKPGKSRKGGIASNAVTALPADPGPPTVCCGMLKGCQQLFLTTDGLGDMMGDGSTSLGMFFQENFPQCSNLLSFLQVMDVSMFQADDDRTGILIREHRI